MTSMTRMRSELLETPERLATQARTNRAAVAAIAAAVNARGNVPWWTVARGSSAHAATFLAAVAGLQAGRLVGKLAPSLFTLYERRPACGDAVVTAISQSGMGADVNA